MNSGASWNERGLSPELYQAAREAARRAGMSVEEWLSSTFGDSNAAATRRDADATTSVRGARLADTVAKLNARLEQLTSGRPAPAEARLGPATVEHAPSIAPESFDLGIDQAVAEIAARQRALDEAPPAPAAQPAAAYAPAPQAAQPAPLAPDLSNLERQLQGIAAQIETLRRPTDIEDVVSALRGDLAEVARSIHEALPRRELETLQSEMHTLAERIDRGYGRGADASALESIERRLNEVHTSLNAMTPAEGVSAFEARIAELSHKMDSMAGASSPDPDMLRYLEAAINELRELSAGVASAEGVASLAGDIQALSARIDHIAEQTGSAGLDSLATRVNELTQALDTRVEQIGPMPSNLASLVQALTEKLNGSDHSSREQAAFALLERQISGIAEKIDAAEHRGGDLSAIERGIQQLTLQVREAREEAIVTAERVARQVAADVAPQGGMEVGALKRDIESLHVNQSESEQRTHETLEAVHDTLERLVERLANVEIGIRSEPQQPAHARQHASMAPAERQEPVMPSILDMRAPEPAATAPVEEPEPQVPAVRTGTPFMNLQRGERAPIDPDLPADTPLEPGSAGRGRSAAERIAASEAVLAPIKRETAPEVTGKANFIAAARRAAQAAASEGGVLETPRAEEQGGTETPTSLIGRFLANRRRALMVGVSALLVIYGTMQVVSMFGGSDPQEAPRSTSGQAQPAAPSKIAAPAAAPAPAAAAAIDPPRVAPAPAAPTKQSSVEPLVAPTPTANLMAPTPIPAAAPAVQPPAPNEITGSIKQPINLAASGASPDKAIPATLGSPALRTAAANGDASAEYEVGVRFAEGRGVQANMDVAIQWLERAAKQGLAPALYRLGSHYEKGQGVKKDLDKARALYLQAADKGNAKAIHNLAVLYAEGIDGKPDYKTASQWFRKAADRGVADSQYNLGILYARGIGVDQNLAESYKWFSLAAQQGDVDAGKKREDVASRLDQQSLVAAKLAVQTFIPDAPPEEAINAKTPPGGWDRATTAATPVKPAATARRKPTSI